MEVILQQAIAIEDDSQIGEARRVAAGLSRAAGLPETEAGRVAIVVNELGSNLRKHAGRGELLLRELSVLGGRGIEVLALDRGPGMDVARSLRDGHSTAGTRGEGLGAVRRLAQEFDAWSVPGHGAAVLARIWQGGAPPFQVQIGAVSRPLAGETECGDAWTMRSGASLLRLLVADGLGHGPMAARAAGAAVESFQRETTQKLPGPEAMLHEVHAALRPTRGAAVAIAELDLITRTLRFGGIGNITAALENGRERSRGLLSHNGIAGHEARRIQEFSLPWPGKGVLVVHSDGLLSHWKLDPQSGLHSHHAAVIAGVLYRDFRRKTDDTTVVVVKEP